MTSVVRKVTLRDLTHAVGTWVDRAHRGETILITRNGRPWARLGDPMLRSLDAIHLATALRLDAPSLAFVTYDKRLAAAAGDEGLVTASPA